MSPKNELEVMLDLETLGTGPNAVILSIGACRFDPHSFLISNLKFEVHVDPKTCVEAGLVMDADTVMWWMDPKRDEARREMMTQPRVPLQNALEQFSWWMGRSSPVWGNGSNFDNVILRNAYRALKVPAPWEYWQDRCYRTMVKMFPEAAVFARQGTHHSAVHDAVSQAVHLQHIMKHLNGE